jgi:hypothetical protein
MIAPRHWHPADLYLSLDVMPSYGHPPGPRLDPPPVWLTDANILAERTRDSGSATGFQPTTGMGRYCAGSTGPVWISRAIVPGPEAENRFNDRLLAQQDLDTPGACSP